MSGLDSDDRLYHAFLRGYQDFGSALGRGSAVPYSSLIQSASQQSKELRRSIDACRSALDQLASLPEAEQTQLKVEARSSLEAMQSVAGQLIAQLTGLRPQTEAAPGAAPKTTSKKAAPKSAAPGSRDSPKPTRVRAEQARTRKPRSTR